MRRPHFEAAPFLAAHGFADAARAAADPTPQPRRWRTPMASDVRFALLTDNPHAKPIAFPDIDALARHIQRARGEAALELVDVDDLELQGDAAPRPGVSVFTTDDSQVRLRLIGHAYLDGRPLGREWLQAALRRNRLVIVEDDAQSEAA